MYHTVRDLMFPYSVVSGEETIVVFRRACLLYRVRNGMFPTDCVQVCGDHVKDTRTNII